MSGVLLVFAHRKFHVLRTFPCFRDEQLVVKKMVVWW